MIAWFLVVLASGIGAPADAVGEDRVAIEGVVIRGAEAIEPPAPTLPGPVLEAIQDRQLEAAERGLKELRERAKDRDERSYYGFLLGVVFRTAGRNDDARRELLAAAAESPKGRWLPKIHGALAGVELAAGNSAAAEELGRMEAQRLLADDRKDQLAEIYHRYARRLLEPEAPLTPPDPAAAWELLAQARELAKSPKLRASLLFEMGRTSQRLGEWLRAVDEFETYAREYPQGTERFAARFSLGEVRLQSGAPILARLVWTDLVRQLDQLQEQERSPEIQELQAQALARIPATYGIPSPPDEAHLSLGVAAIRRFLAAYPAHPRAVRAAYEIGLSFLARGQSEPALDAFRRFLKEPEFRLETDEARREHSELAMAATFQYAQILQAQRRFPEAIAAWRGYLANFPDGPQSADSQRAILETQLQIAADHLARQRYDEARAVWEEFVAENPLDPRVPQVLFQIGESLEIEKKFDRAIAQWGPLISRFPGTEPAAHAQFAIASLFEIEKGDPAAAIERFRQITVEPWKSRAAERIAVMESKSLTVLTPRVFRAGERAYLKITTRNLEKLSFAAYRLNPEAYFRKKHRLEGVEALDVGLVAPDAEWAIEVPGYARYRPIAFDHPLEQLNGPGVHVVKVTDQRTLQATTLVVASDVEALVKASRGQLLVYAQDMTTGVGRPNARVLVSDGKQVILEGQTGVDGVLLHDWPEPQSGASGLAVLVLDGGHVAGSGLRVPEKLAQGLEPRAYLSTDRPAYRPGQTVSIRGVIREVRNGEYFEMPGERYRFEVSDSRGRRLVERTVTLSQFGTFHETIPIDPSAPVGTYRIRVHQPGRSEFLGSFEVQSYQLEPIELRIDLEKTVYYRGEDVEATVVARHRYGAPVTDRRLEIALPDGRTLAVRTDSEGKFRVRFPTEGFAEEQSLRLTARLPEDNVAATASIALALRGLLLDIKTSRDVYLDGESFTVRVAARDPLGNPVATMLSLAAIQRVTEGGQVTERERERKSLETDAKTGEGQLSFRIEDPEGGPYVLRVSGTDRFGNAIVADRLILVSGRKDPTRLRILADRQRFKVGEEVRVNLHCRDGGGTALLTWEADRILSYRIARLAEGDNPIAWAVEGPQFPNFTLTAARMREDQFDEAKLDVDVERELQIEIRPARSTVGPGERIELELTTRDQLGRPVAAELSIAMIDEALLAIYADALPPIGRVFYSQTRTGAFAASASNTFRYAPATVPVSQAVAEDAERAAATHANAADRREVLNRLQVQSQAALERERDKPAGQLRGEAELQDGASQIRVPESMMGGYAGLAPNAPLPQEEARRSLNRALQAPGQGGGVPPEPGLAVDSIAEELRAAGGRMHAKADQPAEPLRQRFVETAYWNPNVVTGTDGKAVVAFEAPGALSTYRLIARGVTGRETLVGQATSSLTVRKDFFVDLKTPAVLTQGDRPRFIARIHHTGVRGQVELRLTVYDAGREQVDPKVVEVDGDGVTEVSFDPVEIVGADPLRVALRAAVGDRTDELVQELPVKPWGVQAMASVSGTSREGTTVFVGLPAGRTYEHPVMTIVLSPSIRRLLVELALSDDRLMPTTWQSSRIYPPPSETLADRGSELLAATSALAYLRELRAAGSPDVERLTSRIQGLVAQLITRQNSDGGWPWVRPPVGDPGGFPGSAAGNALASDRLASAAVVWALAAAEQLGLLVDRTVLDRGVGWLSQALSGLTNPREQDLRSAIVHALSVRKAATFEMANSLSRDRQSLSNPALAFLALTFANLERPELAAEVLDVLIPRAKSESAGAGRPPRLYWEGSAQSLVARGATETTALVCLALARARPRSAELPRAVEWLEHHRIGLNWSPRTALGPAVSALSLYHGRAESADDRYRLTISVNDFPVTTLDVAGSAEGQVLDVPTRFLKAAASNRVALELQGRGSFGYSVTLTAFTRDFAPDQSRAQRAALVERRVYLPAPRELDGRPLPVGFSVALNPRPFENLASQVPLGNRARVSLVVNRNIPYNVPESERDALVVEEHLPAGTTLIEGSVQCSASSYTVADGMLVLYYAPGQYPGLIQYDVYGFLPGRYRTLPAVVRSVQEPGRFHLGQPGELTVLGAGEPLTDPYRPTPDELYARGKAEYEAGRWEEAAAALEPLFAEYTLRDDVEKDAARMLLWTAIDRYEPRQIVRYFEVIRDKAPELVLGFDKLQVIGRAYRDLGELERAWIVWRGLIEASSLEDARVGELLRQQGKTLESVAYLLRLWRDYPNTPAIESDFFGLSQVVFVVASKALSDPQLRRELAAAGVSQSQLLLQTVRMIQVFLAQAPGNPLADEASLAMLGALLELEDHERVVALAGQFAARFPKSTYLDSFLYSQALANFHLGRYDQAITLAEAIARAHYQDASGAEQPSPNKWQALYILGQIHDARRQPAKAVEYYRQVADRFTDAASAIAFYTRKELRVDEVTVVRPEPDPHAAFSPPPPASSVKPPHPGPAPSQDVPQPGAAAAGPSPLAPARLRLGSRNIAQAEITVYPVDLMQLYLSRRNLNQISGIDLAGITPLRELRLSLGNGQNYEDGEQAVELPLPREGAYLVMIRGDDRYASGIVLVTPLELEVLEEAEAGRARVTVRDARSKSPLPKVQVKMIGSDNSEFLSGETDLRGVFVAEGLVGRLTVVVQRDRNQYAFYRGTADLGPPPTARFRQGQAAAGRSPGPVARPSLNQELDVNLKQQNTTNSMRQLQRLQERYQILPPGESKGVPAGDFR